MTQAAISDLHGSDPGLPRSLTGAQLGRYEILCELATGGMATVYVARARGVAGFERLVALKLLHPHLAHEAEFISMFVDEARLAARIRHPNVVATQDISDSEGDGFFLVMDYVEGDHLGSLLARSVRRGHRLAESIAARVMLDALNGLSAAHRLTDEHGHPLHIVHRDISPQNLLVGTDGIARLTDFGVARADVRMSSTSAGQFKGKLAYMAPEQASSGLCDQRSDLFAMGIVLFETLAGRRLFRADSNAATLAKILVDPIPHLSDFVPEFAHWDAVVDKALARRPEDRFQSADEFVEAVEETAARHAGIAAPRAVGHQVRELVGDKLEVEQRRIKDAIARSNGAPNTQPRIPIPASASRVSIPAITSRPSIPALSSHPGLPLVPTHSGVVARDGVLDPDGHYVVVNRMSRRTTAVLSLALVLVAGLAAIAGYFASRPGSAAERVIVAPPSTMPAAPETAPALAAPAPSSATPAARPVVVPAPTDEATPRGRRRAVRARSSETAPATVSAPAETRVAPTRTEELPPPNPYRVY